VLKAFRQATGIRTIPRKPGDKGFRAFSEFCREGFRQYLQHYAETLHAHKPGFQVASNWAYSSHMPEPVGTEVDFLSGDYSLQNSVNAARLEARCLAPQGRPWDLMAWAFGGRFRDRCRSTKTIPQLQQEAAIVLALGGGFQAYFKQKRDGSIYPWTMKLMAATARFCRARQAVCHRAEPVPQIALFLSSAGFYRNNDRLFSPWSGVLNPTKGILQALLDGQQSVEILSEHHLRGRLSAYPLVVIPEWDFIQPAFRRELLAYARGGGRLLCIGPNACKLFRKELGVHCAGRPAEQARWLAHDGWLAGVMSCVQRVQPRRGTEVVGRLYAEDDPVGPGEPAATVRKCGRGRIAGVWFSPGAPYLTAQTTVVRDFLAALVHRLWPRRLVEVEGSHQVDVSLMQKDGRLCVNLVNTAGTHANENIYTYDQIPAVGPLTIRIRLSQRPRRIRLEPEGQRLPFRYGRGVATLTLDRLAIHSILVVEEAGRRS